MIGCRAPVGAGIGRRWEQYAPTHRLVHDVFDSNFPSTSSAGVQVSNGRVLLPNGRDPRADDFIFSVSTPFANKLSREAVWTRTQATRCLETLNGLAAGRALRTTSRPDMSSASNDLVAARRLAHGFLFNEVPLLHRIRRGLGLTGGAAIYEFVRKCNVVS